MTAQPASVRDLEGHAPAGESALRFTVLGRPQPAGSKRGFVNPRTRRVVLVDDARGSRPWKQQVAGAAQDAVAAAAGWELRDPRAMRAEIVFVLGRPRAHYGQGRNAGRVKPGAPEFPAVRPDVDKLSRAVLDALTGIVWRDDGQVVEKVVRKAYGAPERVDVSVRAVGGHRG